MKLVGFQGVPENTSPNSITQPIQKAIQVGVVVRDLEQSMAALAAVFGLGPFRVVECPPPERAPQQFDRGQPAKFRTRQAFADLGASREVVLIRPITHTSRQPSEAG